MNSFGDDQSVILPLVCLIFFLKLCALKFLSLSDHQHGKAPEPNSKGRAGLSSFAHFLQVDDSLEVCTHTFTLLRSDFGKALCFIDWTDLIGL